MWLRHISTEMAKRVNLFLFQGLCVDDAQGQGGLGVQLLEGMQHPTDQHQPTSTKARSEKNQSGKPGFGFKSDV